MDQFSQMADKYAAITEVQDNLQKKREALFATIATIWVSLTPSQRLAAGSYLVQLNRDSKLSLLHEKNFAESLKDATTRVRTKQ